MAIYRTVSLTFWTDSKIDDDFTPEDKYFMLYLITNPHTRISGCYEIGSKQFERETGYNSDTISRLLFRMEKVHNVIRYSKATKEVLILNWSKYNWNGYSPKVLQAVKKEAESIKNPNFKTFILGKIENSDFEYTETDTVSDTVTETVTVTDISVGYGYPIDMVSDLSSDTCPAEDSQITAQDSKTKAVKKSILSDFEELWTLYPKKDGKKDALAAYERAVKKGATKEQVKKGILDYVAYLNANNTEKQYIKNGSTYFRGEHWNDDYTLTGVKPNELFNKYGGISAGAIRGNQDSEDYI